jgi:hypothetical protein
MPEPKPEPPAMAVVSELVDELQSLLDRAKAGTLMGFAGVGVWTDARVSYHAIGYIGTDLVAPALELVRTYAWRQATPPLPAGTIVN